MRLLFALSQVNYIETLRWQVQHLAPCPVPMSFSKDWQIAWPVRISAFTMGWFSLLPWLTTTSQRSAQSLFFPAIKKCDPEVYWLPSINFFALFSLFFDILEAWKIFNDSYNGHTREQTIAIVSIVEILLRVATKLPFTGGLVANKSWPALQAWQDRARFSILILGSKYNSRNKPGRKALLLW